MFFFRKNVLDRNVQPKKRKPTTKLATQEELKAKRQRKPEKIAENKKKVTRNINKKSKGNENKAPEKKAKEKTRKQSNKKQQEKKSRKNREKKEIPLSQQQQKTKAIKEARLPMADRNLSESERKDVTEMSTLRFCKKPYLHQVVLFLFVSGAPFI